MLGLRIDKDLKTNQLVQPYKGFDRTQAQARRTINSMWVGSHLSPVPAAPWGADTVATAYILDLRAKFLPLGPLAPSGDQSWRAHALHMERQCAALKAEFEAELISRLPMV